MTFQNPAGLWLLCGVPVLIIIYLIRSQHEDKKVSSTYIWKLSEKFSKKRLPLQLFRRILLLVLQILAVVLVAFVVARPMLSHRANTDYILIVDSSASMMTEKKDGGSYFEDAKKQASEYSKKVSGGHRVSVIAASDEASCMLRLSSSSNDVQTAVKSLNCTLGGCDLEKAFSVANEIAADCANPRVVLFTDRACENVSSDRVSVVDVSANIVNHSVTDVKTRSDLQYTYIDAEILVSGASEDIILGLRINGEIVDAVEAQCADGEKTVATFTIPKTTFNTAEVFFSGSDAFPADDSFVLCSKHVRARSVYIYSASPLYLQASISSIEGCSVDVVTSFEEYPTGYDLYVFDGDAPEELPMDGSVLIINSEHMPFGATLGAPVENETQILRVNDVDSKICEDWNKTTSVAAAYRPLDLNGSYTTILTCDGNPVMAVKDRSSGLTLSILSFDLHDTNLPLQGKFISFICDLIEFSAPSMIGKTAYAYGENVEINVLPYAGDLYVMDPAEQIRTVPHSSGRAEYLPLSYGVYTAVQTVGEEDGVYADFFVHVPESEYGGEALKDLPDFVFNEKNEAERNATSEITLWIAVAMLILLLAEWGLYYYEQI